MGSLDNGTALRASEAIKNHGWAQDGSLVGAHLREANLEKIRIDRANLTLARLIEANLMYGKMYHTNFSRVLMSGSNLRYGQFNLSNFEHASVDNTDFRDCKLRGCNFKDTLLSESDFENADLDGADLRGANLINANFEGAILGERFGGVRNIKMDENTVLPDGYSWHEGVDLERFIDPYHLEFWRPTNFDLSDLRYDIHDIHDIPDWWLRQQRGHGE